MINVTLSFSEIDYQSVIKNIFPLVFKNKIKLRALQLTAVKRLEKMTSSEQTEYIIKFINEHQDNITEHINSKLIEIGVIANLKGIQTDKK